MSENRTQKSTRNIVFGIIKNIVITLLAFVSRKLFIVYIGVGYLGINGLFSNILSLLSMADLGLGTAMSFSFYKPLVEGDNDKLAALINFYKKLYLFIAIAVATIGICLIPFLDKIINLDKPIPYINLYYLIFLANTVVSYLFVYKSSILTADQKNYLVDIYTIIVNIIKIIVQCICIVLLRNYVVYILLNVVASLVNNIVISYKANKTYPFIRKKLDLDVDSKKDIFKNVKSVFIYKVSSSLLNSIDSIVISIYISTLAVGLYSNYTIITTNLMTFITILFTALTPSIGNLIVKENSESRYNVFALMQKIAFWISGFVTVCVCVLMSEFIEIWLGKDCVMGQEMAIAVSFNLYFSTAMQPIWSFREATGLYNKTKYVMLIAAILNLVLSIVFAQFMGAAGVIFATVIAKASTYFWYEPKLLFGNFFAKKVGSYYMDHLKNILIICILIVGLGYLFNLLPSGNLIWWLIKGCISAIFVNVVYLLLNIKNGTVKEIISRIKRK